MPESSVNVESWGLTLNEVMSLGKPVISTDSVGAAFDLIYNGVNGYRIKNNTVKEMTMVLDKMLKSNNLRQKMGMASLELIKNFTAQKQFESFVKCLQNVSNAQV